MDKRPYNTKSCPISILPEEALALDNGPYWEEPTKQDETPDSRTKAAIWSNYKFYGISLTKTHSNSLRNLEELSKSPLLPKQCEKLVAKYLAVVQENVILIGEILTEVSKELPEKYPNEEAIKRASLNWIHNRYNDKFKSLEPLAREVEAFIRKYLGTDKLLSGQ